jgi:Arc/MetJ family transcription regulator
MTGNMRLGGFIPCHLPEPHPSVPRTYYGCTGLLYIRMCHDVCMKRTTIEIDEKLLARAKRALRLETTRATVEEALRQVADRAEGEHAERAGRQRRYLESLSSRADLALLVSEEMWR